MLLGGGLLVAAHGSLENRIIDLHVSSHGVFGVLNVTVLEKGGRQGQGDLDELFVYRLLIHEA